MNAASILQAALKLIENPASHLQNGMVACDKEGRMTSALSPDACAFCMGGARARAASDLRIGLRPDGLIDHKAENRADELLRDAIEMRAGTRYITSFNDHRSHDECVAVMKEAIMKAQHEAI